MAEETRKMQKVKKLQPIGVSDNEGGDNGDLFFKVVISKTRRRISV